MKNRLSVIAGVLWFVIVSVGFIHMVNQDATQKSYTVDDDSCQAGEYILFSENWKNRGFLYQMTSDGTVQRIFDSAQFAADSRIEKIAYLNRYYAVLSVLPEKMERQYRIIELDKELNITAATGNMAIGDGERLTGFWVEAGNFYLTALASDGSAAYVYEVSFEQLKKPEEQERILGLDCILLRECSPDDFFVEAVYQNGTLSVRRDCDSVSGLFETDNYLKMLFENKTLSFGQKLKRREDWRFAAVLVLVAGWLVISFLTWLVRFQSRTVSLAVLLEVLLSLICGLGYIVTDQIQTQAYIQGKEQLASYVMEELSEEIGNMNHLGFERSDFYEQERYRQIRGIFQETLQRQKKDSGFLDFFVADFDEEIIRISASGFNGHAVEEIYTKACEAFLNKMSGKEISGMAELSLSGQNLKVYGRKGTKTGSSSCVLIGIAEEIEPEGQFQRLRSCYIRGLFVLFLTASLIGVGCIWMQGRRLKLLSDTMQEMAGGSLEVIKPKGYGREMNRLWNGLLELAYQMKNSNNKSYQMLQAYYRFAPKNMDKILKKSSITEVKTGDGIQLNGTLAAITADGWQIAKREEFEMINALLDKIGNYQKQQQGILVSNDCTLSFLQLLLLEDNHKTISLCMDLLNTGKDSPISILLYYGSFMYGIAGTDKQSAAFLVSEDDTVFQEFYGNMRKLGLRLVITEEVKERENAIGTLRYIGFLMANKEQKKIRLYEVLDACDNQCRSQKLSCLKLFEEALELFYQNDFYLALGKFSEILKEAPEDFLSKWYLFVCEKYLNKREADGISYDLNQIL